MKSLGIDQSKSSTGWACWQPGWERPVVGHVCLGTAYTCRGQVFTKLRSTMIELWSTVTEYDWVFHEEAIAHRKQQNTSEENRKLALGLTAYIEGLSYELRCSSSKVIGYEERSWRPDFIGRVHNDDIKRAARAAQRSARDPLKAATVERCRQLGIRVANNDEADAVGILTYGILSHGVTPPWIANETLRPMLAGARS